MTGFCFFYVDHVSFNTGYYDWIWKIIHERRDKTD